MQLGYHLLTVVTFAFFMVFAPSCSQDTLNKRNTLTTSANDSEASTVTPAGDSAPAVSETAVQINEGEDTGLAFDIQVPQDLNLTSNSEEETDDDGEWIPENYDEIMNPDGDISESEDAPEPDTTDSDSPEMDEGHDDMIGPWGKKRGQIRIRCNFGPSFPIRVKGFVKAQLFQQNEAGEMELIGKRIVPLICQKDDLRIKLRNLEDGETYKLAVDLLNRRAKVRYTGETESFTYDPSTPLTVVLNLVRVNFPVDVDITFGDDDDAGDDCEDCNDDDAGDDDADDDHCDHDDAGDDDAGDDDAGDDDAGDDDAGDDYGDDLPTNNICDDEDFDWFFDVEDPLACLIECQDAGFWYDPVANKCTLAEVIPCEAVDYDLLGLSDSQIAEYEAFVERNELIDNNKQLRCFSGGGILLGTMFIETSDNGLIPFVKTRILKILDSAYSSAEAGE